ncbi:MAG TPA: methyltransferase dimerization domain-containing protein [Edaphobacter sp.]|nr:methyltransferase dimerization domain-containing protein [Edaphobacter sp.]
MSDEPNVGHILQVGLGFWSSKTLLSAVELELFTELAKHPETLAELSARLALHPRSARDFLDALVSLGFLERRDGTYYNTPSTDLFLDKRKPSYIGGMLEMANHRLYPFWGTLQKRFAPGSHRTKYAAAKPIPLDCSTPIPNAFAIS